MFSSKKLPENFCNDFTATLVVHTRTGFGDLFDFIIHKFKMLGMFLIINNNNNNNNNT